MSEYITVWVDDLPDLKRKEKITRCRDCKRYHPKESEMFSCRFDYKGFNQWRSAEPNGFCAWSEPREES